jgi:hypothetical protein
MGHSKLMLSIQAGFFILQCKNLLLCGISLQSTAAETWRLLHITKRWCVEILGTIELLNKRRSFFIAGQRRAVEAQAYEERNVRDVGQAVPLNLRSTGRSATAPSR